MGMTYGPIMLLLRSGIAKTQEQARLILLLVMFVCISGIAIIFSVSVIGEVAPTVDFERTTTSNPDVREATRPLDEV